MQPASDADHPSQPRRVLVVDDDPLVGQAIGRLLGPVHVTFAQSPAGAMGRIHAGGVFSAIVCDLFMPGMSGVEFYQEISKAFPGLEQRIVFLTGYRGSEEVSAFLDSVPNLCLEKPPKAEALRSAIASTFAGRRAARRPPQGDRREEP